MLLRIANDYHFPAALRHNISLRNSFHFVICALGMKIRSQLSDERADIVFRENHHCIHRTQCGHHFSPLFLRNSRTSRTFYIARRLVRINGYNQPRIEYDLLCRGEITHMADVQQIKASVGQNDFVAGLAPRFHLFTNGGARKNSL